MSLAPPQAFRKVEFIHRIGLAADRPAAANVLPGTLYFSTDTGVIERSNGTTWATYAGAAAVSDPLIVSTIKGGTANNSTLTLYSSGHATPIAGSDIIFKNGPTTEYLRIAQGGQVILDDSSYFSLRKAGGTVINAFALYEGVSDYVRFYTPIQVGANTTIIDGQVRALDGFFSRYIGEENSSLIVVPSDGSFVLSNWLENDFDLLKFGGTTSSFPALNRNGIILETKLANDSDYTQHTAKFFAVSDAITAPSTQAGKALIYVDSADSDLKVKYGSGTVKSLTSFQDTFLTNTDTGTKTAWAPGIVGDTSLHWFGASDIIIQGITSGVSGLKFKFKNITSNSVAWFTHASGAASAADRLTNLVTIGLTPVAAGGWIEYQHNGTNWKLVDHEQGAWITPAYNSANFGTSGASTWTVASGSVLTECYLLKGTTLFFQLCVAPTSVSAAITYLRWTLPGGYTIWAKRCDGVGTAVDNSVALAAMQWWGQPSVTYLYFAKPGTTNWAIAAGTTNVLASGFVTIV